MSAPRSSFFHRLYAAALAMDHATQLRRNMVALPYFLAPALAASLYLGRVMRVDNGAALRLRKAAEAALAKGQPLSPRAF